MVHSIDWVRAYTRKNQKRVHKLAIARNYKSAYAMIKKRAKAGLNQAIVCHIHDENIARLRKEGYTVEKDFSINETAVRIRW